MVGQRVKFLHLRADSSFLPRPKFFRPTSLAFLFGLALSGCSAKSGTPLLPRESEGTVAVDVANATQGHVSKDVEKSSASMHHFLVGQLAYGAEDFETALSNFEQASELAQEPAPLVHSRLAELNLRFGNVDTALDYARKAVDEEPSEPGARLLYAGILEGVGREQEAEPIYRELIQEFPTQFDAYVLLSNSYVKRNKVDDAITLLRGLLSRNPNEVLARYYLGQAYEKGGKLELAEAEYRAVVAADADRSNAVPDLLRVLLLQKKAEDAKALCNEVLKKDPNNVLARKALGHLMLGEQNLDAALEHLKVVEGAEEDASDTRFKIALIQMGKQNFKEAMRELSLVLAKNPSHDEARYYLASMYAGGGRRKEAITELRQIQPSSEIFVRSRTFLAFVLRQINDFRGAESAIKDAYSRAPNDPQVVLYYVLVLRDQGGAEGAARILRKALASDPNNEKYVFNLALIEHDLGNEEETVRLMERTLQINPANSDALNYLAYSLIERGGDLSRAEKLVGEALRLRPSDSFYLDTLGWLYFKVGRLADAEETLAKAVSASSEDIVIVEHYALVLLAQNKFEEGLKVIRSAIQRAEASGNKDKERVESKYRLEKMYQETIAAHPDLIEAKSKVSN